MKRKPLKIKILIVAILLIGSTVKAQTYDTAKPWTYWFWMGSAVDKPNLERQLEDFHKSGLGGVHIIPVYGAKGYEQQYKSFLSEEWMEMVAFTIDKAASLGLGVDITVGTGWPFGGAMVSDEDAAKQLVVKTFEQENTNQILWDFNKFLTKKNLEEIVAVFVSDGDQQLELSDQVKNRKLEYKVKKGDWRITLIAKGPTKQKVKRAAPGGEGWVMDYFDQPSVQRYFDHFDSVFNASSFNVSPRAYYHDSYEVYNANWTDQFYDVYKERHGYDLRDYLAVLGDREHPDYGLIAHDYRATLSELLYSEFAATWTDWTAKNDKISRYQAHGSPSNLLDLYALADVPETEYFGCREFDIPNLACDPSYNAEKFGRPSPLMIKFASSPAHLMNKRLVSSESGTWLADHFKVPLRSVKPEMDELFTSGINHVFFHGITYSPEEEKYPGWLWYASTNFGQSSHFWNEIPLLNSYISNCQSMLQPATPDNDILLYFPIDDIWTKSVNTDLLLLLDVHHYEDWFSQTSFGKVAKQLWDNGHTFDYISDKQIAEIKVDEGQGFIADNSRYKTIVVPSMEYIPAATLARLEELSGQGLKIIFVDQIAENYPGYASNRLKNEKAVPQETLLSRNQNFQLTKNILEYLKELEIQNESIKIQGLDFIRKKTEDGYLYFVTNLSAEKVSDSLSLAVDYSSVIITDPLTNAKGHIQTTDRFYLDIPPGKSFLIETRMGQPVEGSAWKSYAVSDKLAVDTKWTVQFEPLEGVTLSESYEVTQLTPWTDWEEEELDYYSGKAHYFGSIQLEELDPAVKQYRLTFEEIRETAQIFVNGKDCGTIWSFPNEIVVPAAIMKKENELEIVVGNLSHNYMRKYNLEHPEWKKFYDINFVNIRYDPYAPEQSPPEPAGIIGAISLIAEK